MCTLLDISWVIGLFLSWFFLHWIPYFCSFETIYHMLDLEFCARRYSDLKLRQSCCPKFAQANFGSLERIFPRLSEFGAVDWVFTAKNSLERIYFAQANLSDPRRDYKRQKLIFWRHLGSKRVPCDFGGEEGGSWPPWLRTPGFTTSMELGGGRRHSTKFIFMGSFYPFPFYPWS